LNVKNNVNGTSSNIASGTVLGLGPMLNYTARTNELPFLANWNNTGNSEKYNNWIIDNTIMNVHGLSYTFQPQLTGTLPSIFAAKFDRTSSATIQATPSEGITGTIVSLRDPWYYYSDAQNNWYHSDEYRNYASPFVIEKNSSNSYERLLMKNSLTVRPLQDLTAQSSLSLLPGLLLTASAWDLLQNATA
jgi:hypothetical protein